MVSSELIVRAVRRMRARKIMEIILQMHFHFPIRGVESGQVEPGFFGRLDDVSITSYGPLTVEITERVLS